MKYQVTKEGCNKFTVWRKGWFFWHVVRENIISLESAKNFIQWDRNERAPSVVVHEE